MTKKPFLTLKAPASQRIRIKGFEICRSTTVTPGKCDSLFNLAVVVGQCAVTSLPSTIVTLKATAGRRIRIKGFEIRDDGRISSTDMPVRVEVGKIVTNSVAGTVVPVIRMTGNASPVAVRGIYRKTYSSEPTYGNIMRTWVVHPQGGPHFLKYDTEIRDGGEIGLRMCSCLAENLAVAVFVVEVG